MVNIPAGPKQYFNDLELDTKDRYYLNLINGAAVVALDVSAVITPHASIPGTRIVNMQLVDEDGNWLTMLNGPATLAIAKVSASGTVSIVNTAINFVNGAAQIVITRAGTWVAGDTNTLTISGIKVCGTTIPTVTSVETAS